MNNNPLKKLENPGQTIWPDYILRDLIAFGEPECLIRYERITKKATYVI